MSSSEVDHSVWTVMQVRLSETLPKTDRYDILRLDSRILGIRLPSPMRNSACLGTK
jgi:hypothetical protein